MLIGTIQKQPNSFFFELFLSFFSFSLFPFLSLEAFRFSLSLSPVAEFRSFLVGQGLESWISLSVGAKVFSRRVLLPKKKGTQQISSF